MDMGSTIPIAFWLLPGEADAQWLDARIRTLAAQHGGPTFEPHVTLHVGRCSPDADIEAMLAALALREQCPGLTLEAGRTLESPVRFKALFIDLPTDRCDGAELLRLRHDLVEELLKADNPGAVTPAMAADPAILEKALAGYRFLPHLSLLYGELPQALRLELAAGNDVEGRAIRFERIAAVKPRPGHADLSGVERWQVFGHRRLIA